MQNGANLCIYGVVYYSGIFIEEVVKKKSKISRYFRV